MGSCFGSSDKVMNSIVIRIAMQGNLKFPEKRKPQAEDPVAAFSGKGLTYSTMNLPFMME